MSLRFVGGAVAFALFAVLVTAMAPAPRAATPSPTGAPSPDDFPASSDDFPASFYTGPLGADNVLPPKTTGALVGTWLPGTPPGSTEAQYRQLLLERESYIGRKYDWVASHWGAPADRCDWGPGYQPYSTDREAWIMDGGRDLIMNWTHGWTIAAVNAGEADECLRATARRAAAFGRVHLLRIYWEFDGDWFRWSGTGSTFIAAWQRTVNIFRQEGATNVGFIWSPGGGDRERAFGGYPGDEWVDWVGISDYNHNNENAWCAPWPVGAPGWCEFAHTLSHDPVNFPTIYDVYSGHKPFMAGEAGSVEDPFTPGRKGQWFRNIRNQVPTRTPNVRGISYFDQDMADLEANAPNWRVDTSASSLQGWRDLVLSPFFRTR